MAKLDIKALGLASGILWATCVFVFGLLSRFFGWGGPWISMLSMFYIGYKSTLLGSFIGALWGFVDAGILAVLLAWLYNKFAG